MNYFTTTNSNYTQYRPAGAPAARIWDNGRLVNFDKARNRLFAKLVKEAFPNARIIMDRRIKAVVGPDLSYIEGDTPYHYNHHTHMHIALGKIN